MKTSFCMIYFEVGMSVANFAKSIVGPKLFLTQEAAVDELFDYVENQIFDGREDVLESMGDIECRDDVERFMKEAKSSLDGKMSLIEHYFSYMKDDRNQTGFLIKEVPTASFIESISRADAVEINGDFIRHFEVKSRDSDGVCDGSEPFFDVTLVVDGYSETHYEFTLDDAKNATYDIEREFWIVGKDELEILVINFDKNAI
jgi:hypothetical protein